MHPMNLLRWLVLAFDWNKLLEKDVFRVMKVLVVLRDRHMFSPEIRKEIQMLLVKREGVILQEGIISTSNILPR